MKGQINPRRAIAQAEDSPAMLENRKGKLRLDMNENVLGCSPKARAALLRLDAEDFSMYPEKENAVERLAPHFGVHADEMLVTCGIDDALRLIADVFLERGRRVLLVEPTFPMYRFYAGQREARIVSLRYDSGMNFPLRDALTALRSAPDVFFLANPNNPTAGLVGRREIEEILDAARRTLVVVDEAYFEFSGVTMLREIRRRRNLIVTRTFSKTSGLAGLRVGCAFAHREIAKLLKRAQAPFPISAPALAVAEAALKDKAFVRRYIGEILQARKILINGLGRLGIRTFPSAANFVLVDFGARGPSAISALRRRGILIRDQSGAFGRPGFVRITVGTSAQMRRFLKALEPLV